jgi:hypothetical protein
MQESEHQTQFTEGLELKAQLKLPSEYRLKSKFRIAAPVSLVKRAFWEPQHARIDESNS